MKYNVKIFKDLYDNQKDIARSVFSKKYSYVTIKSGRQAGKSFTLDRCGIGLALQYYNSEIIWITPTHGQSLDAFERIEHILNGKIDYVSSKSPNDRRITFNNKSRIRFFTAERYDNLRGKHPDYVILDEFAFFKEGAWEFAIKPYFIANKDLICIAASTPAGKNDFYNLYNKISDNSISHDLHYSLNPKANLEFIEEEKKTLPVQVYEQEYEGLFVFGSSQVFGEFINNQQINEWIPPSVVIVSIPGRRNRW